MSVPSAEKKRSKAASSFAMPADTWDAKLREHHDRMGKVKTTINKEPPYQLSFRSPKKSPRGPSALGSSPPSRGSSRASSASRSMHLQSLGATGLATSHGIPSAPRPALTVDDLPDDERKLCDNFIKMLTRKSTEDTKALLEAIYVRSETKRLLKGYGGVFPSLAQQRRSSSAAEE